MPHSDEQPRVDEAMAESLLVTIEKLVRQGDERHAQHIAELERTLASLKEVVRVMATQALKLADIKPPSDPADAAVVEGVLEQARKAMEFLEPPSH